MQTEQKSQVCGLHAASFENLKELLTERLRGIEQMIDAKFVLLAERIRCDGLKENMQRLQMRVDEVEDIVAAAKIAAQTARDLEARVKGVEQRQWTISGVLVAVGVVADVFLRHLVK